MLIYIKYLVRYNKKMINERFAEFGQIKPE